MEKQLLNQQKVRARDRVLPPCAAGTRNNERGGVGRDSFALALQCASEAAISIESV